MFPFPYITMYTPTGNIRSLPGPDLPRFIQACGNTSAQATDTPTTSSSSAVFILLLPTAAQPPSTCECTVNSDASYNVSRHLSQGEITITSLDDQRDECQWVNDECRRGGKADQKLTVIFGLNGRCGSFVILAVQGRCRLASGWVVFRYAYTRTCMHTRARTHSLTRTHMHTHSLTRTYRHTHIRIHIRMHAYKHNDPPPPPADIHIVV